jgi:1,2-diacylglycerol 3-alpha-glucosyltransferase
VVAVIWIDWYAYHIARLRALTQHDRLRGQVMGIELVGGCGVHPGMRFREEERGELPLVTLLPKADWRKSLEPRLALEVWRKLNEANPDLVLVPGYHTLPGLCGAVWARLHRRRSVLMCETTRSDHRRVWWKELTKRSLVRLLFQGAIAGGQPHTRYLTELGLRGPIGRAYDVVDNDYYARGTGQARATLDPSQLGLPEDYFLYVGRLSPEKNVDGLIGAFADFRAAGGRASLVLCGDGPLRRQLVTQAENAGVREHVHFEGLKTTAELLPYYAFARAFVLPSTREPWGLVVNEAMASGLPVIVSTRCGCAEDLVRGNGLVFDPARPDTLRKCLSVVAGMSSGEVAAWGKCSLEIIDRYSPGVWASEVAQLAGNCG